MFFPQLQYYNSFNYFWSKWLHWQGVLTELTDCTVQWWLFCRCVTPTNLTLSFSIHTKWHQSYIHTCAKKNIKTSAIFVHFSSII